MNRDWQDFKALHSNLPGARSAFENACETLFRKIHSKENVQQVEVKQGDGGIDIFIGEIGVKPISVVQCKFFIECFEDSQKNQIRSSFNTAIKASKYEMSDWTLCIPMNIDIDAHSWWAKWKNKKIEEYSKSSEFIRIKTGSELIDLLKEYGLYNEVFQITDSLLIKDTNEKVSKIFEDAQRSIKHDGPSIDERKKINKVLFNNYTIENEAYYLERDIDKHLISDSYHSNVWLFGRSGTGKTTLINRNLILNKIDFIFCDMSSISVESIDQIFNEIIFEIKDKFDCDELPADLNQIRSITSLLSSCKINEQFIIVIDELSISDVTLLKAFADKIVRLVSFYNTKYDNQYIRFIISTINEPKDIIKNKEKASEYFCYLNSNSWSDCLNELLAIIDAGLGLKLKDSINAQLIEKSDKNPRLLKFIVRKILLSKIKSESELGVLIDKAVKEFYLL